MIYISSMSNVNISAKDLNLLVIFESLSRTFNVSKTAKELAVSQSAVSHALSRLRDMFGDPLFTRVARGMVATPKATELMPRIAQSIEHLRSVFEVTEFKKETATGKIVIASTEYLEQAFLAKMFMEVRKTSPGLVFQFRNASGRLPKVQLEQGEIDIGIAGFFGVLPEGFYQQKLFDNDFACIARSKHPKIKNKITMELYIELEHLLISPQGDLWGLMDDRLLQQKKKRKVIAGFENYMTPGWIVSETDSILTAPRALCEFFASTLKVQMYELPIPSPKISLVQVWHERTNSNPLHQFIRAKIAETSSYLKK